MEKRFKVKDTEFIVDELTIEQDELIAQILEEIGISDVLDFGGLNVEKILQGLHQKKLLRRFMALILVPVNAEFDESRIDEIAGILAKMKSSDMLAALEEFSKKNESWVKKLVSFFKDFQDQNQAAAEKAKKSGSTGDFVSNLPRADSGDTKQAES